MKCADVQRNMLGFIEGELEPRKYREVKKHLESCPQCASCEMKFAKAIRYIQLEKQADVDIRMFAAVQEALAMPDADEHRKPVTGLIQALSFATMLILAMIAGVYIGKEFAFEKSVASDFQTELLYLSNIHMEYHVIVPLSGQNNEP